MPQKIRQTGPSFLSLSRQTVFINPAILIS